MNTALELFIGALWLGIILLAIAIVRVGARGEGK